MYYFFPIGGTLLAYELSASNFGRHFSFEDTRGSQEVFCQAKNLKRFKKFQKNFIKKEKNLLLLRYPHFFVNICRTKTWASWYHYGRSDHPNSWVYFQLLQQVPRVWQIIDLPILSHAVGIDGICSVQSPVHMESAWILSTWSL